MQLVCCTFSMSVCLLHLSRHARACRAYTAPAHSITQMRCRGYKVVIKFFPNEAANLEPVVDLLLCLEEQVCWVLPVYYP